VHAVIPLDAHLLELGPASRCGHAGSDEPHFEALEVQDEHPWQLRDAEARKHAVAAAALYRARQLQGLLPEKVSQQAQQ